MKEKLQKIARHPVTKKALMDMKPQKTLWGILGIVLFFIAPEIVAYFYAIDITHFAQEALLTNPPLIEKYSYDLLIMIFKDGVSWFNLGFGVVLLLWLFF